MNFVDTHAHFQSAGCDQGERLTRELWAKAPELTGDRIVNNAVQAGVTKMLCVGCDVADSQLAVDFVQATEQVWASVGVHPHEAAKESPNLAALKALVGQLKVVAIGECGLDYFYNHSGRDDQLRVLKYQMELAVEAGLPMIFHVREALDDFWPLFDSFQGNIRGVLHSFTDSRANLDKALERNLLIGVNGIVTFVKDPQQLDVYKAIPPSSLLLETDAPYLTPVPFRGKINQSKQITTIADYVAQLRGEDVAVLAKTTTRNAEQLFDI